GRVGGHAGHPRRRPPQFRAGAAPVRDGAGGAGRPPGPRHRGAGSRGGSGPVGTRGERGRAGGGVATACFVIMTRYAPIPGTRRSWYATSRTRIMITRAGTGGVAARS